MRKWIGRYLAEGWTGLENRSSRPRSAAVQASWWRKKAEQFRKDYRLTAQEIATKLDLARSTVAAWLKLAGLGKLKALDPKPPVRRYQRERAGELLHLDIKKLGRFEGHGHRITGNRKDCTLGLGWDYLHVAIDDAIRLAYVEVLPDETRHSTSAFLVRALRWFRRHGVAVERVMTDNGSGYIAKLFRKILRMLNIKHIRTRPYTPKTNGKAERFIQTMLRDGPPLFPSNPQKPERRICPDG